MSDLKRRKSNKAGEEKDRVTVIKNTLKSNKKTEKSINQGIPLRVLARIVVIFSLLVIVYFTYDGKKVVTFAKRDQKIPGQGQVVECSPDYIKDINKFERCIPQDCGRYVTDTVVSDNEVDSLLNIAKKALAYSRSDGGASILDLNSGALSAGEKFINIYKNEATKDLVKPEHFQVYRVVKEKIKYAIAQHFSLQPDKLYLTHPTFFSELTSSPAVSLHDEYWHPHVDKETYVSFHYTSLLYLSNYGLDFEGGRFVFIDANANRTVEPRKGRVSMFTSGAENMHYVEKVTKGVRYAMTISFTCDKKHAIADPVAKN